MQQAILEKPLLSNVLYHLLAQTPRQHKLLVNESVTKRSWPEISQIHEIKITLQTA